MIKATLTLVVMMLNTQISKAAGENVIDGTNVSIVTYQDPRTGQTVTIKPSPKNRGNWIEHTPNGAKSFAVVQRDKWSVYLWDASRGIAMQLDLHQKRINLGPGDASGMIKAKTDFYHILGANRTKGPSVTAAAYRDPQTGRTVPVSVSSRDRNKWIEHSPNGAFSFRVIAKDEWSVYLFDKRRNMALQIDLFQKKIKYGTANSNRTIGANAGAYSIMWSQ